MKKSPKNQEKPDKPDEPFASPSDVDELKRLHATFVGLGQLFDTVLSESPERIEALGKNPFFDQIRGLVKKVPRLNTEKQFQSFAVELDKAAGAWPESMVSMDQMMSGNLPAQFIVDQMIYEPAAFQKQFLALEHPPFAAAAVQPLMNLLGLLQSDAIDPAKRQQWGDVSLNVFSGIRNSAARAALSEQAKKGAAARRKAPDAVAKDEAFDRVKAKYLAARQAAGNKPVNKAKFAVTMLTEEPDLESTQTIERLTRKWEKELPGS